MVLTRSKPGIRRQQRRPGHLRHALRIPNFVFRMPHTHASR
jgi:hypothetical protein